MNSITKCFSLLAVVLFFFSACIPQEDLAPIFKNVTFNNVDGTNLVSISAGEELFIGAEFIDDVSLAYYSVRIYHANKISGTNILELSESFDLLGTIQQTSQGIGIPESTLAGPYTVEIAVYDANGSSSGAASYNIAIYNETMANIDISEPEKGSSFRQGEVIPVSGLITDEIDLTYVKIRVEPALFSSRLSTGRVPIYLETFMLEGPDDKNWNFDELNLSNKSIQIPNNISTAGEYRILIEAEDNQKNIAISETKILINK